MRFKIDWASLIVGRKITFFAFFYFVCEGNFQVQAPPPGGTLIVGGAYTWKGLFFGLILRYALLTKRVVRTAGYWPSSFLRFCVDQDEAGANRNAKKGRGQYPSILTHLFSNEDVEAIVTNLHRSCRERLESSRRLLRGSIRLELGLPKSFNKGAV